MTLVRTTACAVVGCVSFSGGVFDPSDDCVGVEDVCLGGVVESVPVEAELVLGVGCVVPVFFAFVVGDDVDAEVFEFGPVGGVGVGGFVVGDEVFLIDVCFFGGIDGEDGGVSVVDGFVDVGGLGVVAVLVIGLDGLGGDGVVDGVAGAAGELECSGVVGVGVGGLSCLVSGGGFVGGWEDCGWVLVGGVVLCLGGVVVSGSCVGLDVLGGESVEVGVVGVVGLFVGCGWVGVVVGEEVVGLGGVELDGVVFEVGVGGVDGCGVGCLVGVGGAGDVLVAVGVLGVGGVEVVGVALSVVGDVGGFAGFELDFFVEPLGAGLGVLLLELLALLLGCVFLGGGAVGCPGCPGVVVGVAFAFEVADGWVVLLVEFLGDVFAELWCVEGLSVLEVLCEGLGDLVVDFCGVLECVVGEGLVAVDLGCAVGEVFGGWVFGVVGAFEGVAAEEGA